VRGTGWISAAWAAAFAIMSGVDALATYVRGTPERFVLLVNLAALVAVITLTLRLAAHLRRTRDY
jgi:steroid 5-alpha reductase family enzyme